MALVTGPAELTWFNLVPVAWTLAIDAGQRQGKANGPRKVAGEALPMLGGEMGKSVPKAL